MKDLNEVVDPLTIASIVAITGGAVAITATLAKKLHNVLSDRSVNFKVEKTYELIKRKYPAIFVMEAVSHISKYAKQLQPQSHLLRLVYARSTAW